MSKKKKDLKVLERRIISLIRSFPNREFNYKKIAFSIKVNDQKGRDDIVMVLNSLLKKEKIIKMESGNFVAPAIETNSAEGRLEITSTGRGYVVCDDLDGDVLIEQRNLNKGLHGDVVSVVVGSKNSRNKYEGKVVEVVKRNKEVFVGVFQKQKEYAFVNTRNERMYTDFFIEKDAINRLVSGFYSETIAFVFSDVLIHNTDTNKKYPTTSKRKIFDLSDLTYNFFANKVQVYPCSTLLKREDIKRLGGYSSFNVNNSCDVCVWLSILIDRPYAVRIPAALTVYTVHNSLSSASVEEWQDEFSGIRRVLDGKREIIQGIDYRKIVSGLNIGLNRIPIGYISRSFRYNHEYGLISALIDMYKWKKLIFTLDNILFAARKIFLKK